VNGYLLSLSGSQFTVYMKIDGHSGVGHYPVLVPAFTGMTTWIPDRVGNDMRHFHASLCPGMRVSWLSFFMAL